MLPGTRQRYTPSPVHNIALQCAAQPSNKALRNIAGCSFLRCNERLKDEKKNPTETKPGNNPDDNLHDEEPKTMKVRTSTPYKSRSSSLRLLAWSLIDYFLGATLSPISTENILACVTREHTKERGYNNSTQRRTKRNGRGQG